MKPGQRGGSVPVKKCDTKKNTNCSCKKCVTPKKIQIVRVKNVRHQKKIQIVGVPAVHTF